MNRINKIWKSVEGALSKSENISGVEELRGVALKLSKAQRAVLADIVKRASTFKSGQALLDGRSLASMGSLRKLGLITVDKIMSESFRRGGPNGKLVTVRMWLVSPTDKGKAVVQN